MALRLTQIGWFLIFGVRAILAPIFFVLLSSADGLNAAAPVSAIGVIGTLLIGASIPIGVAFEGMKTTLGWRIVVLATSLSIISTLLLVVVMFATYAR